jgi:hypothetical protein
MHHVTEARGSFGAFGRWSRQELKLRRQAGSLGDARKHLRTNFFIVVECEEKSGQFARARVRWDPDCRLTCRPTFKSVARTRRALVAGQLLKQPGR